MDLLPLPEVRGRVAPDGMLEFQGDSIRHEDLTFYKTTEIFNVVDGPLHLVIVGGSPILIQPYVLGTQ